MALCVMVNGWIDGICLITHVIYIYIYIDDIFISKKNHDIRIFMNGNGHESINSISIPRIAMMVLM